MFFGWYLLGAEDPFSTHENENNKFFVGLFFIQNLSEVVNNLCNKSLH